MVARQNFGYFWIALQLILSFTDFSENLFLQWVRKKTELVRDSVYELDCVWTKRGKKKERWHIGIENMGSSKEQGTRARVEREDSGGAKVNMMTGEKRATGSTTRNEIQDLSLDKTV